MPTAVDSTNFQLRPDLPDDTEAMRSACFCSAVEIALRVKYYAAVRRRSISAAGEVVARTA